MYAGVGQEHVCGCVQGFPTSRTAVPVSDSSRGSYSLPTHAAEVGWNNPLPLCQRLWNQGQSSFLIDPAASNGAGPGSEGNSHWSEMEIF